MSNGAKESWHLDKRLPLALLGGLMLQTLAVGWWAATMSARLDYAEKYNSKLASQIEALGTALTPLPTRLAVLETKWVHISQSLNRIEARLDVIPMPETGRGRFNYDPQ